MNVREDEERFAGLPAAAVQGCTGGFFCIRAHSALGNTHYTPYLEIVLKTRYDGSLAYPPKLLKKSVQCLWLADTAKVHKKYSTLLYKV